MAIIDTHLRKAKKKNRNCFENGCSKKAIDSHILQKNGIISMITEMLLQIENWIVSETFYHLKIKSKEGAIKSIISWAQQNWNERVSLDFNLFT